MEGNILRKKKELSQKIEEIERLWNQLKIGRRDKEEAENLILRTLDELGWIIRDDVEQKAYVEEALRYTEILNAMGRSFIEEEENHLSALLERLKDEERRLIEEQRYEKLDVFWS